MRARRRFLDGGHYRPLLGPVLRAVQGRRRVVDVGCGDGWFTARAASRTGELLGVDISKLAVRYAARRDPDSTYVVASAFDLPLFDESVDAMVNVLGPMVPAEYERVLAPGAPAVVVRPAGDHLPEVRRMLELPPRPARPSALAHSSSFELQDIERVRFSVDLPDAQDRSDLVAMTPIADRLSSEEVKWLGSHLPRSVEVDLQIEVHLRRAGVRVAVKRGSG